MFDLVHTPVLGGTAPTSARRTAGKLAGFAVRHLGCIERPAAAPHRYLDIGCGNGFITEQVAAHFQDAVGIDVEHERLREFRARVAGETRFSIHEISADATGFSAAAFAFITCFEVLEHVPDLQGVVDEMTRLCAPGGVIVVSTPQVWFPFENHGMQIGGRVIDRKIPLLPYVPPLHHRLARARVFSSARLDRLFVARGMRLLSTAYATPQFERAAVRPGTWESRLQFLRPVLDRCETIPGLRQLTGVSILKAYAKPIAGWPVHLP
jgi:2-polyprenyl-3-methyl-5-hydroxy-6-metoxy-1,4-benzoquinol methylase